MARQQDTQEFFRVAPIAYNLHRGMTLTQRQQQDIARYLQAVSGFAEGIPDRRREEELKRLYAEILKRLESLGKSPPDNADVAGVLRAFGTPEEAGAAMAARLRPGGTVYLAVEERIWLGVCGGIANQLDIDPLVVRIAAVAIGLATLGLALIPYLIAYGILYYLSDKGQVPAWSPWKTARRTGLATVLAFGLLIGGRLVLAGALFVFRQAMPPELAYIGGGWDWFIENDGALFFWTLALSLPLAALSSLPVKPGWDRTHRKMYQAALALYAVAVCFGVASAVAGMLLRVGTQTSGLELPPFPL